MSNDPPPRPRIRCSRPYSLDAPPLPVEDDGTIVLYCGDDDFLYPFGRDGTEPPEEPDPDWPPLFARRRAVLRALREADRVIYAAGATADDVAAAVARVDAFGEKWASDVIRDTVARASRGDRGFLDP